MNKIILIGRIAKDIELRATPNGTLVVRFSLAVNRRVKQGSMAEVDFFNIVAWQGLADTINKYCRKGDQLAIEGRLQNSSYERNGQTRITTEIIAESIDFGAKKGNSNTNTHKEVKDEFEQEIEQIELDDNDLPF